MGSRKRKGITFIVVRPEGTILMQLRDAKSKHFPDAWCLPGGACNTGEKPIDAVLREAEEEYELKLNKHECRLVTVYEPNYDKSLTDYIFLCSIDATQRPVMHEGADMKWMSIEEVKNLELGFEQEAVITKLENALKQR